jgi:hypothetical protein
MFKLQPTIQQETMMDCRLDGLVSTLKVSNKVAITIYKLPWVTSCVQTTIHETTASILSSYAYMQLHGGL